jgi:hypothetical protein
MCMTTTISVVLTSPSHDRDRLQFESPVAGTGDQSCSVVEEVRALDGALLAGVHRPMQAHDDDMKQQHTKAQ